jgi:hypothetical protein
MSDQSKVVINNVEKEQRDNLLKVHSKDQSFTNIQMTVSSNDRGDESTEHRILQHSGTPRGWAGAVQQRPWSAQLSDRSSVAPSACS